MKFPSLPALEVFQCWVALLQYCPLLFFQTFRIYMWTNSAFGVPEKFQWFPEQVWGLLRSSNSLFPFLVPLSLARPLGGEEEEFKKKIHFKKKNIST